MDVAVGEAFGDGEASLTFLERGTAGCCCILFLNIALPS